jgi:hypothetical protein
MITIKIDFDDMGNMWEKKFTEEVGEKHDDQNDKHCEIFSRIQLETNKKIESSLYEIFEDTIVLEFEY